MIPESTILQWTEFAPWINNAQVEQDLAICRALISTFSNDYLAERLAFRGGIALHKLYLHPQSRYSEDIDLVQIKSEPISKTINELRSSLEFLGKPIVRQKLHNNTLIFKFNSEIPPIVPIKLKVEINCREHFNVLGLSKIKFGTETKWFSGNCEIVTYQLAELLGTKLRALYQRKKGRDLFDLYKALSKQKIDAIDVIKCYKQYMQFAAGNPPNRKEYLQNMDLKMKDDEFIGDMTGLLRPSENYDPYVAYELVKKKLLEKL